MTTNTQNYNRFSYVLNNPLKYTDPSGYIVNWGRPRPPRTGGCSNGNGGSNFFYNFFKGIGSFFGGIGGVFGDAFGSMEFTSGPGSDASLSIGIPFISFGDGVGSNPGLSQSASIGGGFSGSALTNRNNPPSIYNVVKGDPPRKINLSANYYNQTIAVFQYVKIIEKSNEIWGDGIEWGYTKPNDYRPIESFVNYNSYNNNYFTRMNSFLVQAYSSIESPILTVADKGNKLKMEVRVNLYEAKVEFNKDGHLKPNQSASGIAYIYIPARNTMSGIDSRIGITLQFNLSDPQQYKLFVSAYSTLFY